MKNEDAREHKCLFLRGARRVGKSYKVEDNITYIPIFALDWYL